MDEFVGKKIKKAIDEGRLSHPDQDPFIKKLKRNQRRHEKRDRENKA